MFHLMFSILLSQPDREGRDQNLATRLNWVQRFAFVFLLFYRGLSFWYWRPDWLVLFGELEDMFMRRCDLLPCICDVWLKHAFGHLWLEDMQISDTIARVTCVPPSPNSTTATCGGYRAQGAMYGISPSVCDLRIFASRPERRVVRRAVHSFLCAMISFSMATYDIDRFIPYRPGWVLEIPG